jgi:nucleotide-binding universal stress UspA family protein
VDFASAVFLIISASLQVSGVIFEVVEGDPRNVLCEAVEKHHASVLVVGSHGYGAIKRYLILSSLFHSFLPPNDLMHHILFSNLGH